MGARRLYKDNITATRGGFCVPVWKTGPGKRLGQTGRVGSLGRGRSVVCGPVCEYRPSSTIDVDSAGGASNLATAKVQRPVAGEAYLRKSASAIFYWNEGV